MANAHDFGGSQTSFPDASADPLSPEEAVSVEIQALPALISEPNVDDQWVAHAVDAVETAITKLVDQFLKHPFTHRVEHSLHVQLYQLLSESHQLSGMHPIGNTGFKTQLIHKEWPETKPRPGKNGRGSFDLAILSPHQLANVQNIEQFIHGRIAAPIVVELGLGYQDVHLGGDVGKLLASKIQHPYLVHFSRLRSNKRSATEAMIAELRLPIKIAYVHHDIEGKKVFCKHLDSLVIDKTDYSAE